MRKVKVDDIVKDVRLVIDEIADNDSELEEATKDDTEMDSIIESKIEDALHFVFANADESLLEPDTIYDSSKVTKATDVTYNDNGVGLIKLPTSFIRLLYAKIKSWIRAISHKDLVNETDPDYAMLQNKYCTGTAQRPKGAIVESGSNKTLELYTGNKVNILAVFEGDEYCTLIKGEVPSAKGIWTIVKVGEGWYVRTISDWEEEPEKRICVVKYDKTSEVSTSPYVLTLYEESAFDESALYNEDYIRAGIVTEPTKIATSETSEEKNGYAIPDNVYRSVLYYIAGLTMVTYRDAQSAQMFFQEANDLMGMTQAISQSRAVEQQQVGE